MAEQRFGKVMAVMKGPTSCTFSFVMYPVPLVANLDLLAQETPAAV